VWVTVQALERMEELEAACSSADDEAAGPDASLLVEGHISDILKPDVYLSADKKFVTYVNERINVNSPSPFPSASPSPVSVIRAIRGRHTTIGSFNSSVPNGGVALTNHALRFMHTCSLLQSVHA
jgi:hypothetical protein